MSLSPITGADPDGPEHQHDCYHAAVRPADQRSRGRCHPEYLRTASKDLNLLARLYNDYKTNPSARALQKIQGVIADSDQNLPALLQAAHIGDPVLSARVAAGVNLILTTVASFAELMPQTSVLPMAQKMAHQQVAIPKTSDLKKPWNQRGCGPTSNSSLDFSTRAARSDSAAIFRRPAATHASTCAGRAGGDFVFAR